FENCDASKITKIEDFNATTMPASSYFSGDPKTPKVFQERRRRYQNLANQCVSLENELRTLCDFPDATDEE
ncbi:TPA: hypothetical protein ACNS9M_004478, partial [Escherichia coli]